MKADEKQNLLRQAYAHLDKREWAAADEIALRVANAEPGDADAPHIHALVLASRGQHGEAEPFFRHSLALKPEEPSYLVNFGRSLSQVGKHEEARMRFQDALKLKPDFEDAQIELGFAFLQSNLYAAEAIFRGVLQHDPNSLRARHGLSTILIQTERPAEAEPILRGALAPIDAEDAMRPVLELNLAVALLRMERAEEAIVLLDKVVKSDIANAVLIARHRADGLQQLGRNGEALSAYREALKREPHDTGVHDEMNNLLYRMEREDFLHSYDDALRKSPFVIEMPFRKGYFLMRLHRYAEALEAFGAALKINPDDPGVLNGYAAAAAGLGRFDEAIAFHESAAKRDPNDINARSTFATTLLQAGDPQRALRLLADNMAKAPRDQNTLALLGLALRGTNDARDEWLMGYDALVQVFDLEPPAGYSDMAAFNRDLDAQLSVLHTDKREHPDQTQRGGTKSRGDLFLGRLGNTEGPVQLVRAQIDAAMRTFVARMAADEKHPFLGRKREGLRYSGSWSSRLHDAGFHTNHIHTKGWISSCYYVAVPDAVADATAQQGWIKFGEPPFDAHLKEPVRRTVQPKPGRLVLFPSYMWHGTIPFHSNAARTTIAFDAVPA